MKLDTTDANYPRITFIYAPLHTITIRHIDESGNTIDADQTVEVVDKDSFEFMPADIAGYKTPAKVSLTALKDQVVTLRYTKIETKVPERSISTGAAIKKNPYTYTYIPKTHTVYAAPKSVSRTSSNDAAPTKPADNTLKKFNFAGKIKPFMIPEVGYDPFSFNQGLNIEQGRTFKDELLRLKNEGKQLYGNDIDKVNKYILNGIAWYVYHEDKLQNMVIEFASPVHFNTKVDKILDSNHKNPIGVDISHIGTSLLSTYDHGTFRNLFKSLLGTSLTPLPLGSREDNFFMINTMLGDALTVISHKDDISDMDAYILKYNKSLVGETIADKWIYLYDMDDYFIKRNQIYKETLRSQGANTESANDLVRKNIINSLLTLGGLGLVLYYSMKYKDDIINIIINPNNLAEDKKSFVDYKIGWWYKYFVEPITKKRKEILDFLSKFTFDTKKALINKVNSVGRLSARMNL